VVVFHSIFVKPSNLYKDFHNALMLQSIIISSYNQNDTIKAEEELKKNYIDIGFGVKGCVVLISCAVFIPPLNNVKISFLKYNILFSFT
tara:strand:+ start:424 stop:690 length:267 start_codon:yes stop_codon:yes gene_type:complete